MTESIREVSAPGSTAEPEHVMSETGATRLAALTPDQLALPVEDAPAAEGNDDSDPQAERTTPRPEVDASAIEPLVVSDRYREVAETYRTDVARLSAEANIPAGEASAFFQMAGGIAAEMQATDEDNATLSAGQTPGPSMRNTDETHSRLRSRYGDMYPAVVRQAQQEYNALPAQARDYLNKPNEYGDRLENHVAVVIALAFRGFSRLSPEAAEQEMGRLRSSREFVTGDRLTLDKVRALAHVIAGKRETPATPQTRGRGIVFPTGGSEPVNPSQGSQAAKALRAELNKLQAKDSDLYSSDGVKRKRAVARRAAIQSQLGGQP